MDEHAAKKKVELDTGAPAAATSDAKQAPKEEPEGENTSFCCAICSTEDIPIETRAVLPCCGTIGSSLQYCRRCIEVIIERGIEGRLGKCPTCNSWLSEKVASSLLCSAFPCDHVLTWVTRLPERSICHARVASCALHHVHAGESHCRRGSSPV